MRLAKAAFLLAGLVLLGFVVAETDMAEVWERLSEVGIWGIVVILLIHLVSTVGEAIGWQLTLPSVRLSRGWLYRLWMLRCVGSAYNNITPFASLGGEPVKAVVLKRHYGVGYREGSASLILDRTAGALGLALFLIVGFLVLLAAGSLPPEYTTAAGTGLALLSGGILGFFLVQRFKLVSRLGGRLGGRGPKFLQRTIETVGDVEDRLVTFYTVHRARFAGAVAVSFVNWGLGTFEIYFALYFLGHSVTFADAVVIEAVTVLVRNALFFIPAGVGVQDGAFYLVTAAITGSGALGLALAVLRRFREIAWVLTGLILGWTYALTPELEPAPGAKREGPVPSA
ncbi:MAG: flippase-like domain-containing protein [Alphaproteobacteria bacterium]|nr:flippase-like domain-containing protein [Alphaproteobacteria bacterium]